MKMGKNKNRRRRQQQSGRPVLVTFYVARPIRDGGAAATAFAHDVWKHNHHHHHHLHLHGSGHEARRGPKDGRSYNRRADLLEYSRQLRALARQTTTTAATRPEPLRPSGPRRRDTDTVGAVRDAGQPAAGTSLSLAGRRLERARSQQQIRQRCFGSRGWSWKRVFVLVFPFHSNSHNGRSKSKRSTRRPHQDSEKNRNNNKMGWPAALVVGKLTVSKSSRDHSGLAKKLMSVFRQRSR